MPPVLVCFADQDSRVRYYACESMYNIAKVARGSILRYFNELFDAMSKVSACLTSVICMQCRAQETLVAYTELPFFNPHSFMPTQKCQLRTEQSC